MKTLLIKKSVNISLTFFNTNASVPIFATKPNQSVQLNFYTTALRETERPGEMAVGTQHWGRWIIISWWMMTCLLCMCEKLENMTAPQI